MSGPPMAACRYVKACPESISLPMHAYLDEPTQERITGRYARALST